MLPRVPEPEAQPDRPRLVVVGSVNVDHVVVAPALPGPGETVVGGDLARNGGGKGANAAVAAARLGADVRLLAAVGDDDLGEDALAELARDGVEVGAVARVGAATGAALIVVDEHGENQIAVAQGANGHVGAELVERVLPGLLDGAAAVLVSCEIPLDGVAAALALARDAGTLAVLNPAPVREGLADVLDLAPLLTPNAGEARTLSGEDDLARAADALAARTGAPVVVTLGGDGALVVPRAGAEGRTVAPPPLPGPVRDTTGAGDTFNGALTVELAAGAGLEDAVALAQRAAGHAVRERGARAGMPTRDALGVMVPQPPPVTP